MLLTCFNIMGWCVNQNGKNGGSQQLIQLNDFEFNSLNALGLNLDLVSLQILKVNLDGINVLSKNAK